MRAKTLVSTTLLTLLLCPLAARAQFNQHWLPVEQGKLDSHIDLQLQYSRLDFLNDELNIVILSLEGQYAIKDRFEVGLGIPMVYNQVSSLGASSEDAAFGDMLVKFSSALADFAQRIFQVGRG